MGQRIAQLQRDVDDADHHPMHHRDFRVVSEQQGELKQTTDRLVKGFVCPLGIASTGELPSAFQLSVIIEIQLAKAQLLFFESLRVTGRRDA